MTLIIMSARLFVRMKHLLCFELEGFRTFDPLVLPWSSFTRPSWSSLPILGLGFLSLSQASFAWTCSALRFQPREYHRELTSSVGKVIFLWNIFLYRW